MSTLALSLALTTFSLLVAAQDISMTMIVTSVVPIVATGNDSLLHTSYSTYYVPVLMPVVGATSADALSVFLGALTTVTQPYSPVAYLGPSTTASTAPTSAAKSSAAILGLFQQNSTEISLSSTRPPGLVASTANPISNLSSISSRILGSAITSMSMNTSSTSDKPLIITMSQPLTTTQTAELTATTVSTASGREKATSTTLQSKESIKPTPATTTAAPPASAGLRLRSHMTPVAIVILFFAFCYMVAI